MMHANCGLAQALEWQNHYRCSVLLHPWRAANSHLLSTLHSEMCKAWRASPLRQCTVKKWVCHLCSLWTLCTCWKCSAETHCRRVSTFCCKFVRPNSVQGGTKGSVRDSTRNTPSVAVSLRKWATFDLQMCTSAHRYVRQISIHT